MKFMFRYGNFLLHIVHNEYDALENFRQAQNIYQSKMSKKGNATPINEQTIFGENSSSAIVLISATSTRIGTVVHANEEIESVLGFKRQELIGRNVIQIIPRPIARAHDKLIQRYFETAKPNVIEIKRNLLA
jgi:PAS domain-containing protein